MLRMKIKMIDLLVKIANGEESINVETKYDSNDWVKDDFLLSLYNEFEHKNNYEIVEFLNDYVEIIEEEPKPITKESIEALGYACGEIRKCFENGWNKSLENKPLIEDPKKIEKIEMCTGGIMGFDGVENITTELKNKINELIDEINNLKDND